MLPTMMRRLSDVDDVDVDGDEGAVADVGEAGFYGWQCGLLS